MKNIFKKNYGIIINIFGLITVLFIIYIALNFTSINKNDHDDIDFEEYLVNLGFKEDNIKEGFLVPGFNPATMPLQFVKLAFAILSVTFIAKFAKYMFNIATGLVEAMYGSLLTAVFGTQQIALGLPDFLIFALYCIRWFVDHVMCAITGLFNLPTCIFFYIINTIGQLLYLPSRGLFFLIWLAGFEEIYDYEKKAWNKIYDIDEWIFVNIIPLHFAHWPIEVRQKCFSCVRLKMSSVSNKFLPVGDRYGKKLPKAVGPHVKTMGNGFKKVIEALSAIFGYK